MRNNRAATITASSCTGRLLQMIMAYSLALGPSTTRAFAAGRATRIVRPFGLRNNHNNGAPALLPLTARSPRCSVGVIIGTSRPSVASHAYRRTRSQPCRLYVSASNGQDVMNENNIHNSPNVNNNNNNNNNNSPETTNPQSQISTNAISITTRRQFSSYSHDSNNNDNDQLWEIPKSIDIPVDKIDVSFVRSSGAGGQNVNKVNTKVELRFHVLEAEWLPLEVRQRLYEQQRSRINKKGFLSIQSQEHRTQEKNRKTAVAKLESIILEAYPRPKERKMRKGVSKATKERNKEFKRRRSQVKQTRGGVSSRDW